MTGKFTDVFLFFTYFLTQRSVIKHINGKFLLQICPANSGTVTIAPFGEVLLNELG